VLIESPRWSTLLDNHLRNVPSLRMSMSRLPLVLNIPQNDIPPSSAKSGHSTPLTNLAIQASESDYDAICVPLTNDLWRERWERLCLRPVDDEVDFEEAYQGRNKNSATREWLEREKRKRDTEKEAEIWRCYGGFKRTELNITRLGESNPLYA
jgi:protein arginine N-methyltransferase 5